MSPYWQNQSCDPYTPESTACGLGNYVAYSINVTGVDDIKTGISFVEQHNVRLVIKNTGHEYVILSMLLSYSLGVGANRAIIN